MSKTQAAEEKGSSAILFQREGMPPIGEMLPCALQHVLASFAGIITPAILIAATFDFTTQQRTDIIQVALILSAIDTALQAFAPFRRIGGNLPIVMGVSFAFLPALQAMGATFSFGALLGGEIVGGIAAILFGIFYGKLKAFFPPVVTGTVIFTIGVSLYPTAIKYMAGGEGTPLWGTPQAWCVALVTFAVVFGLNNFAKGTLKLGSVFFGMIAGIIVSAPFGMLDFSPVIGIGLLSVVQSIFQIYGIYGRMTLSLIVCLFIQAFWSYGLSIFFTFGFILLVMKTIASFTPNSAFGMAMGRVSGFTEPLTDWIRRTFFRSRFAKESTVSLISLLIFAVLYFVCRYCFGLLYSLALRIPF